MALYTKEQLEDMAYKIVASEPLVIDLDDVLSIVEKYEEKLNAYEQELQWRESLGMNSE